MMTARAAFVPVCLMCFLLLCAGGDSSAGALAQENGKIASGPSWPPRGTSIRCPVTRDTSISAVAGEEEGSNGGAGQLKLKGTQEFSLLDMDPGPLRGRLVTGALLHVRCASPNQAPLARVGVSTVAAPWVEGDSKNYRPQLGSSCFSWAELGKRPWAYADGNVMDVSFGQGNTLWSFADCTPPDGAGWQACAVDADVVAARGAGLSHGFLLQDEVGNTWSLKNGTFQYHYFPNRFFYSRETEDSAPWFEIWTDGTDSCPPDPVNGVQIDTEGFPPGEPLVRWNTPDDRGGGKTLGFLVDASQGSVEMPVPRHLIPSAGLTGQEVRMHLHGLAVKPGEKLNVSIRPVDCAGNMGEPFQTSVTLASSSVHSLPHVQAVSPFPPSISLPKVSGVAVSVVDLLDKIDPQTGRMVPAHPAGYRGGNHIFSAERKLVRLQSARNEWVSFQLNLQGRANGVSVTYDFEAHPRLQTRIYEFAYVESPDAVREGRSFLPDPLVPLAGKVSIPSGAGAVRIADQTHHSLLCEVYVPHEEAPGPKTGKVTISVGSETLSLEVDLTVWDFTLPDRLSFVPEMNAYGEVSPYSGYAHYRLAHEHRTCVNRLPYGWDGVPAFAPVWNGTDFDWSEWDRKVGPLLDGSAFKDLPRRGKPVDVFYLPFNENWPVSLKRHYRPSYWADEAFTETYAAELARAFAAFAHHCDEKGWYDTIFQFYLNNKIYHRKEFPGATAPWVFDEPVNTQDFWALRWYGLLWRSAVDPVKGRAQMWYRGDISFSQFSRNLLWGVMDVQYLGDNNPQKTRMKRHEDVVYGKSSFAEYGTANSIGEPNTQPVMWCLSAWAKGASGVLPWQTMGNRDSWTRADQNALFYPHPDGPKPSLRLKAFTRGQQDVEYLNLFLEVFWQPRCVVSEWLDAKIDLEGEVVRTSPGDAGTLRFRTNDPSLLWRTRYLVAEGLSGRALRSNGQISYEMSKQYGIKQPHQLGLVYPDPQTETIKPEVESPVW